MIVEINLVKELYPNIVLMLATLVYQAKKSIKVIVRNNSYSGGGGKFSFEGKGILPSHLDQKFLGNLYQGSTTYNLLQASEKATTEELVTKVSKNYLSWFGDIIIDFGKIKFTDKLETLLALEKNNCSGHYAIAMPSLHSPEKVEVIILSHGDNLKRVSSYVNNNGVSLPFITKEISKKDLYGQEISQRFWRPHLVLNLQDYYFVKTTENHLIKNFIVDNAQEFARYFIENRWYYYEGSHGVLYVDSNGISHKAPCSFNEIIS